MLLKQIASIACNTVCKEPFKYKQNLVAHDSNFTVYAGGSWWTACWATVTDIFFVYLMCSYSFFVFEHTPHDLCFSQCFQTQHTVDIFRYIKLSSNWIDVKSYIRIPGYILEHIFVLWCDLMNRWTVVKLGHILLPIFFSWKCFRSF